jgi:hypothetical protein
MSGRYSAPGIIYQLARTSRIEEIVRVQRRGLAICRSTIRIHGLTYKASDPLDRGSLTKPHRPTTYELLRVSFTTSLPVYLTQSYTMRFLSTAFLASVLGAGIVNGATAAPRMVSITFSGNGCPQGANNTVSANGGTLTFTYNDYSVILGGPEGRAAATSNCQAHISFDQGIPGYALTVQSVSGRGLMYATPNVTLSVLTTLFWSQNASNTVRPCPSPNNARVNHRLNR